MEKYNAVYGNRVIAFEAESYRKALLLAVAHFETADIDKITLRAVAPWRPFDADRERQSALVPDSLDGVTLPREDIPK